MAVAFSFPWRTFASDYCAAAKYDGRLRRLFVRFRDGRTAEYDNVSEQEAKSFLAAGSKGKWIWSHIRVRGSKTAHRKPWHYV